jgi:hypothetical protein
MYVRHLHAELVARGHIQPAPAGTRGPRPGTPTRPPIVRQRRTEPSLDTRQPNPGIEITR